jgi:putative aminopeptidase FrvX
MYGNDLAIGDFACGDVCTNAAAVYECDVSAGHCKVSICAKDAFGPYNYELTNRLIELAKIYGIDYAVDLYYRYGTDANAAVQGGHDVRTASFGMAVYCSHGRERTHMDGLEGTAKLLLAYIVCGA